MFFKSGSLGDIMLSLYFSNHYGDTGSPIIFTSWSLLIYLTVLLQLFLHVSVGLVLINFGLNIFDHINRMIAINGNF